MRFILRNKRIKSGLTQVQLASKAKISEVHYQRLEYGTRNPSLRVAKNLAKALGTTVEELFPD